MAALGLLVRLVFGVFYWVDKPLTHDEREYLALSQSMAAGTALFMDHGHETGTAQQFGRAPVYPLFLAAIGAGAEDNTSSPIRVKIAQALVGAVGVWIIGDDCHPDGRSHGGIAAAAIAARYPLSSGSPRTF